jgi:hypothetical protein
MLKKRLINRFKIAIDEWFTENSIPLHVCIIYVWLDPQTLSRSLSLSRSHESSGVMYLTYPLDFAFRPVAWLNQGCQIFLGMYNKLKREIMYQVTKNIPNRNKIYRLAEK